MSTRAIDKLTPQVRDTVHAYTDPDSPTYSKKGPSTATAYPNMTPESAQAHSAQVFRRLPVKAAVAEILEDRDAGYKVRVNRLADIATGREKVETVTEQWIKPSDDKPLSLIGKTVTTRPVPFADQLTALKKISKDTGEDAVVGVQNKLIHDDLLHLGETMLRVHQRAATGKQEASVDPSLPPEAEESASSCPDSPDGPPVDESSASCETDSHHVSKSIQSIDSDSSASAAPIAVVVPDETSSQGVSFCAQSGDGARGGKGGRPPSIPSPLPISNKKAIAPPSELW